MTWGAELLNVEARDGNVVALVRFSSDAGETFNQECPGNDLTPDSLGAWCQMICEQREKRDESLALFADFTLGVIELPRDIAAKAAAAQAAAAAPASP